MKRLRHILLLTVALTPLGLGSAAAGPQGPVVVGGSATVVNPGSANVTVNQFSDKAIINWNLFNIGVNERVQFVQPNSGSIILNRVTGGLGPSMILGTLDANGHVFIVNRDGIVFGPNAVVNTAGLLATTSDIRNQDFMAGRFNFNIPGRPDASIVNLGTITANNGGFAALVAPGVRNSGTITATLGTVSLAAGNTFSLDFYGDKLVTLAVGDQIAASVKDVATGLPLNALVTNDGKIRANGGRVELTAAAARQVVDAVINTSGVIEANTIGTNKGMIVLGAATATTKPAGAPVQTVKVSGTITAAGKRKGTKGGTVIVTGENIVVANATINVSGRDAGGKALIGGDWGGGHPDKSLVSNPSAQLESFAVPTATTVSVDAASTINASAIDKGNGGKVIVWSDQYTSFAGTILALGGKQLGDGGFAEVSSHGVLNYTGITDLRAPNGSFGTLLLDPYDITISDGIDTQLSFTGGTYAPTNTSIINYLTLQTALLNGNVTLTTGGTLSPGKDVGNINVNHGFTWNSGSTLTLSAYNNINFGAGVVVSNTGAGSLILRADNSGTGVGYVSLSAGQINWSASTGNVSIYYDPIGGYTFPTYPYPYPTFVTTNSGVPNQLTAYMLVNNVTDLQNISTNLAGIYALGTNIDASSNPNFAPIGSISFPFTGKLDGNGGLGVNYTISNLTIAPTDPNIQNVGMFGVIGPGAFVGNLNLVNVQVTANPNFVGPGQFVGTLAGSNAGTISNVTVDGTVNGVGPVGVIAGGLVGQNGVLYLNNQNQVPGLITLAHANVAVTVGDGGLCTGTTCSGFNTAGGLVGSNVAGSTISFSDAAGAVLAGMSSNAGGLVGQNGFSGNNPPIQSFGFILNSFATGTVTVTGLNTSAGGLVGTQGDGSTITDSQAFGAVMSTARGTMDGDFHSAGGLVGQNQGTITSTTLPAVGTPCVRGSAFACAAGPVSVGDFGRAGGLVGDNNGVITGAFATGTVTGGDNTNLGGLAGNNGGCDNNCSSLPVKITDSWASGTVTGGMFSFVGGFVGQNNGLITRSNATGAVNGGTNSIIGGFVAGNGVESGTISFSTSSGPVTGSSESYLGGFVGINVALIQNSNSTSTVTATGSHNVVGGLVGLNLGVIDPSHSSGNVTSGPDSTVGGFVGANAAIRFPDGTQFIGTISSDSNGTGTATGGPNSTVGPQVGQSYPTSGLPNLPHGTCNGGGDANLCGAVLFNPNPQQPDDTGPQSPQLVVTSQLLKDPDTKTPDNPVPTTTTTTTTAPTAPHGPNPGNTWPGGGKPPSWFGPNAILGSGMPPLTETRYASDEVVVQLRDNVTPELLTAIEQQLGLTVIATQEIGLLGRTIYRFKITSGLPVRNVIAVFESKNFTAQAQPSYVFALAQAPATPAETEGDSAQYIVSKLRLAEVHKLATGKDVLVAVVDSAIDVNHPDLQGVIAGKFDSASADEKPHPHGTGMAGAIASHKRLIGIAPHARLLAIQAFGVNSGSAQGTSLNIVKGLNWAVEQGARVINMSFAGPMDPILQQAIKALHEKGIILIAAAGNAGPKSPPLYPGADPNVIAVSATDVDDQTYKNANRGKYIAISAPGVDILVPAPDGGYQLTTGTSVAAAHISGVAALLLERNPGLKPDALKKILMSTADKPPGSRPEDIGAGLVDPLKALLKVDPKSAGVQ